MDDLLASMETVNGDVFFSDLTAEDSQFDSFAAGFGGATQDERDATYAADIAGFDGSAQGAMTALQNAGIDTSQIFVAEDGSGIYDNEGGVIPEGSSLYQQTKDALSAAFSGANKALTAANTPLGRLLTTLGLGALTLGAGRAIAGSASPIRLPDFESGQNPVLLAGGAAAARALNNPATQEALSDTVSRTVGGYAGMSSLLAAEIARQAEENNARAPYMQSIRNVSLERLPYWLPTGLEGTQLGERLTRINSALDETLNNRPATFSDPLLPSLTEKAKALIDGGVDAFRVDDPVESAIRQRLLNAIEGKEVDPALERRIAEGREVLNNRLKAMYGGRAGADIEGTVGGGVTNDYDMKANELRYGVNRDVMALLSPEERARRQFSINNPEALYLNRFNALVPQQGARQIGQENVNLARDAIDEAAEAAAAVAKPMNNTDLTPGYRKRMVRVYVARALGELAGPGA